MPHILHLSRVAAETTSSSLQTICLLLLFDPESGWMRYGRKSYHHTHTNRSWPKPNPSAGVYPKRPQSAPVRCQQPPSNTGALKPQREQTQHVCVYETCRVTSGLRAGKIDQLHAEQLGRHEIGTIPRQCLSGWIFSEWWEADESPSSHHGEEVKQWFTPLERKISFSFVNKSFD